MTPTALVSRARILASLARVATTEQHRAELRTRATLAYAYLWRSLEQRDFGQAAKLHYVKR